MSERALLKADDITIFKLLENGKEISDALACIKTWWAQKKIGRRGRTAQGGPVRLN